MAADRRARRSRPDPLVTYLQDHLAGAAAAIELLDLLREQHAGEPLEPFALDLRREVEADRVTLEELAERAGGGPSVVKEATAWIGAKFARLKLSHHVAGQLGALETLETLALGVLGKLALWRALEVVASSEPRLAGVDFGQLAARATTQHDRIETRRLEAARAALAARPADRTRSA